MWWIFTAWLAAVAVAAPQDSRTAVLQEMTGQISALERALQRKGDDADSYRKLGLLYQSRDAHFHAGGVDKPNALRAFNRALEVDGGRTPALMVQVNHHKGMLLKMMNRGKESLEALEEALEYVQCAHDRAGVLHSIADSQVFLARVDDGVETYKQVLEVAPYHLESYLPLTSCYKELNALSKQEWLEFLNEMEYAVERFKNGDFDVPATRADVKRSALTTGPTTALGGPVRSSAVYWAMYVLVYGRVGGPTFTPHILPPLVLLSLRTGTPPRKKRRCWTSPGRTSSRRTAWNWPRKAARLTATAWCNKRKASRRSSTRGSGPPGWARTARRRCSSWA